MLQNKYTTWMALRATGTGKNVKNVEANKYVWRKGAKALQKGGERMAESVYLFLIWDLKIY